jgi:hypothetical protein
MQIVKLEDIIKMSTLLSENGFSDKNIEVILKLKTNELLNKINEDIYYKNKTSDSPPLSHTDEIILNVNGITFKYVVDEN